MRFPIVLQDVLFIDRRAVSRFHEIKQRWKNKTTFKSNKLSFFFNEQNSKLSSKFHFFLRLVKTISLNLSKISPSTIPSHEKNTSHPFERFIDHKHRTKLYSYKTCIQLRYHRLRWRRRQALSLLPKERRQPWMRD